MMMWLSIAAGVVVAILGWNLVRRFGADRIAEFNERRRPQSRIVSRGELVDGSRHVPVALALNKSTFFYENSDMHASLDLHWIREVEYDTRLATGHAVESGKVLRLRCYSQVFEFVLPEDVVDRWVVNLPPRQRAEPPTAGEVAVVAGV
jgi:hypothetical protein